MAPLRKQSHQDGVPNLPLLTRRACGELRASAEQHLLRAEAWLKQVSDSIVARNPALQQAVLRLGDYRAGVQMNRAPSTKQVVLRSCNFAAIIPGDSVAEMVISSSVYNFLNLYNTVLIARLVLTWFPSAPEVIVNPLSTICDPYLNVFRGIIPPLGTIDLSPILAFTVLNVFTSTAQALPCELDHKPQQKLGWRQLVQRRKGLKGPESK
jgi:YggT family protein